MTGAVSSAAATSVASTGTALATAAPTASMATTTTVTEAASPAEAVSATASVASTTGALASATVSASAAPAAGIITINHMDWWSPNTPVLVTFFNGNKADFEAQNPKIKVNYVFAAGYISDANPKLNFRFAPPPQGPLASSPGSTAWTSAYGMPIGGKQKDAAWEWLSSVNSEPAQEKYFAPVQKRPSARKAVYQSAA